MQRRTNFDAVRQMIGRAFRRAEVAALGELGIEIATGRMASVPMASR